MSEPVKSVTYSCGKEGHKSPSCPDKSSSKNPDRDGGKHLRVQAFELSNCRREDPTLPGKVNGKEIPFILDSAALITVVPEEFVNLKGSGCGEITLRLAGDVLNVAKTVDAELSVGSYIGKQNVAVLPGESLDNTVLLSAPLTRPYSFSLFCELKQQLEREKDTAAGVKAVQTRTMRKAEQEEELLNREAERMMNIGIGCDDENVSIEETRDEVLMKEDGSDKAGSLEVERGRVEEEESTEEVMQRE